MFGDHPRACGEHLPWVEVDTEDLGSSLCLRGTYAGIAGGCAPAGIIPALAGNIVSACLASLPRWDHPRACGEHRCGMYLINGVVGSSPRLRGTFP